MAHELAHIVLSHDLFTKPDQYAAQETEADNLICQWGFEREQSRRRKNKRRRKLV